MSTDDTCQTCGGTGEDPRYPRDRPDQVTVPCPDCQPTRRQPPGDPRLATIATRLRSLRVEVNRLDDAIGLLHRDDHRRLVAWTFILRDAVDGLEQNVEQMAADGSPR